MKPFYKDEVALKMTLVGFGHAGSRMVDVLAGYKDAKGNALYNTLALNSNDGDLTALKNIPVDNRVSLKLGGLGKNPELAMSILDSNDRARETLKEFIKDRIEPNDEMIIFFAGLGGGTGTSTIVKAISEFYEYNTKPMFQKELKRLIDEHGADKVQANLDDYVQQAYETIEAKLPKIGVVAALPIRDSGADVLRQSNVFAQKIWELGQDEDKGISFIMFPDNQFFYDKYDKLSASQKSRYGSYRDFANTELAESLHELNVAAKAGGSEVVLDAADFKRAITQGKGCLVISRVEKNAEEAPFEKDIEDLLISSQNHPTLHEAIKIKETINGEDQYKRIYNVGSVAILDYRKAKKYGPGAFLDTANANLRKTLYNFETSFTGYTLLDNIPNHDNKPKVTAYTLFKVDGLPERLEKGLIKEYEEYQANEEKLVFSDSKFADITKKSRKVKLNLEDLGIDEMFDTQIQKTKAPVQEEKSDKIAEILEMTNNVEFSKLKNKMK